MGNHCDMSCFLQLDDGKIWLEGAGLSFCDCFDRIGAMWWLRFPVIPVKMHFLAVAKATVWELDPNVLYVGYFQFLLVKSQCLLTLNFNWWNPHFFSICESTSFLTRRWSTTFVQERQLAWSLAVVFADVFWARWCPSSVVLANRTTITTILCRE